MCDDSQNCSMEDSKAFSTLDNTNLKVHTGDCAHDDDTRPEAEGTFYEKCVDWRDTLRFESSAHGDSSYNTLKWIGHIGFYVPRANSCHCIGKAVDLTKIKWNGVDCEPCRVDHQHTDRRVRRRYLAVDASLRKHFKWVLDGWYNSDHAYHIHASAHYANVSNIVLDKLSKSDTVFVQAACNNFNSAGLVVDGDWGPATETAFGNINSKWDFDVSQCNPFTSHQAYVDWLHRVMAAGFADVGAGSVDVADGCNFPPRRPRHES